MAGTPANSGLAFLTIDKMSYFVCRVYVIVRQQFAYRMEPLKKLKNAFAEMTMFSNQIGLL